MTRIFKHLIRIIKHKYWVARYCFQLGLYWQGIVHDWSKFSYTEFSRSIKYWDDTISPLANEKNIHGYSETFLHHRGRNPHHYEYWVHSLDEGGVPAKMPRKYALELVCDYLAACVVNGELKEIFKHPKTDDGTKNSLKGLIAVYKCLDGKYTATDQVSIEEEKEGCLETVFEDGILKKEYSLEEIRQRIDHGL